MDFLMSFLEKSLNNYPALYSLLIGLGIGWGLKSGIEKLIESLADKYFLIVDNQRAIKKKMESQKKETLSFLEKLEQKIDTILSKI